MKKIVRTMLAGPCLILPWLLVLYSNSAAAQSEAPSLTPLPAYIAGKNMADDPAAMEYVFMRCAGLYMATSKALARTDDPNGEVLGKVSVQASEKFFEAAVKAEAAGNAAPDADTFKAASGQLVQLSGAYIKLMMMAQARRGDASSDPTIMKDLEVCKPLLASSSN